MLPFLEKEYISRKVIHNKLNNINKINYCFYYL